MKEILTIFGVIVLGALIVVGATEGVYQMTAHYAPRYEDVRRTTFEESRTFQEGTIRDLDNLRLEYLKASGDEKEAVADTARHRFADVPINQLPPSLQDFATQVGAR